MSWQAEIDELNRRRQTALALGGPEKVARHKQSGSLTARERIESLLDPDSFEEVGMLAGRAEYDAAGHLMSIAPSSLLFGRGRIDGRPVAVSANDFTIRGGASDGGIGRKSLMAERMALELRLPMLRLIDGAGGSVRSLEAMGRSYIPDNPGWETVVENMAVVPVVGLGVGIAAGINAPRLVASHYSLMVEGTSFMFMAGPPVVARLGEKVTKEELGGARLHARAGAIDDVVGTEAEAFVRARRFLSYLPSSVYELAPRGPQTDDPGRRDPWLVEAIPRQKRKVFDMRRILAAVFDRDSLLEIGAAYGGSMITALARLDGWPVAVLASDPRIYGGGWTAATSEKVARFIDLADTFHLPVVTMIDIPGFVVGVASEKAGTVRAGARALAALYQATTPICAVVLRKAFGVAGGAHINHARFPYRFAWPSADWGSMPFEGGIEAAYSAELAAASNPREALAEIEARLNRLTSPLRTAEAFGVEDIIDPSETRPSLCRFANLAARLRQPGRRTYGMRP
jgi:acetyl-CoA carboxylase carboxyltransferase component